MRPEKDEPVFHSDWERSVLTMFPAMATAGVFNIDQFRAAMERIPAAEYLTTRYYEHWIHSMTELGVNAGVFELDARTQQILAQPRNAHHQKPVLEPVAVVSGKGGA